MRFSRVFVCQRGGFMLPVLLELEFTTTDRGLQPLQPPYSGLNAHEQG